MEHKYDIFISYRRKDSGDKAEHLKDLLEPLYKGRISFDRENLTGIFDVALIKRIDQCIDFILVLGKHSLEYKRDVDDDGHEIEDSGDFSSEQVELYRYLSTCTQSDFSKKIEEMGANAPIDFVRIEIGRALQRKDIKIIPIVPERTESYAFNSLKLPPDIAGIQRHEAVFYSDNPDALFKDVVPKIRKHMRSKPDSYLVKRLLLSVISFLIILAICFGFWKYNQLQMIKKARKELMVTQIKDFVIEWRPDISLEQLQAIHEIFDKMEFVEGGTFLMGADGINEDVEKDLETPQIQQTVQSFHMGRYEVSVSQWCRVMKMPYPSENANLPMTNISLDDCIAFCDTLFNLTNVNFTIPTEAEWEYAARGGVKHNKTKYAGSNNPDEVAWYIKNSRKRLHVCDARETGMYDNHINLFDMSGNVSEWCVWTDSVYRLYSDMVVKKRTESDVIYNKGVSIIRGGDYLSDPYQLAVYHRETSDRLQRSPNIGLRLIIKDNNSYYE